MNYFAAASAMGAFLVLLATAWAWILGRFFAGLDARADRLYLVYYAAGALLYLKVEMRTRKQAAHA